MGYLFDYTKCNPREECKKNGSEVSTIFITIKARMM